MSVSVCGLVLMIIYTTIIIKHVRSKKNAIQRIKWDFLKVAIVIALFTNMGTVFGNVSFNVLSIRVYLFVALVDYFLGRKKISKKTFCWFSGLLIIVIMSFARLMISMNMPQVIPTATVMDEVFMGTATTAKASFSSINIVNFINLFVWVVSIMLSYKELNDRDHVEELMEFLHKSFYVFFVFVTIEFILNNLLSAREVRNVILSAMGVVDRAKVYYPQSRFGFYNFDGLYSEQSYISMMIVYYGIVYINGLRSNKERLFFVWSIIVLIMSSSTTGLYYLLIVVLVVVHLFLPNQERIMSGRTKKRMLLFLIFFIVIAASLIFARRDDITRVYSSMSLKLNAFMYGSALSSNSIINSGAIRNNANEIALKAFLAKPILGVGVGTTRAYGIWAGMLPSFGIMGVIAYFGFCNSVFHYRVKAKKGLTVSIIVLFYVILSVNFLYSMAMVPIMLLLSRNYMGEYNVSK